MASISLTEASLRRTLAPPTWQLQSIMGEYCREAGTQVWMNLVRLDWDETGQMEGRTTNLGPGSERLLEVQLRTWYNGQCFPGSSRFRTKETLQGSNPEPGG